MRWPFPPLRSARATLAWVALAATVAVMALIGAGAYLVTEQRFRHQRDLDWAHVQRHLGPSVAKALWVYDLPGLQAVLEAELGGAVRGVRVLDPQGGIVMQVGVVFPVQGLAPASPVQVLSIPVPPVESQQLGRIDVAWSDDALHQAQRDTLALLGVQTIGVCMVLLLVVWLGLSRVIFQPVARLQAALEQALAREEATDSVTLPPSGYDEFGAITVSINAIVQRLGAELEAGRSAEEEARAALSHLQNAQEGLVRAEKMAALGSLVAGVAHELNTPIGNIVMVTSTQQERTADFSKAVQAGSLSRKRLDAFLAQVQEGADLAFNNATRAADLIHSFKQVAVDQTSERLREFDLATHIAEILSVTSPLLKKGNVSVQRDLQPGIRLYTYPGSLGQVLTNLLTNAVVHAFEHRQDGVIHLRCEAQGEQARITVQDNGCGMPPEVLARVFDPFFTTKLGRGGTGLGLHICHNIVYGPLHGQLRVHSVVGEGSTFTVDLPRRLPQDASQPQPLL